MQKILISLILMGITFLFPVFGQTPIDKKATIQTQALYANLKKLSQQRLLVGHQDDEAYGTNWRSVQGRSDIKEVTGSYPAIHGWDVAKLGTSTFNIDSVSFDKMRGWIKETYKRGGINTISWHLDNPATKKNALDTGKAVKEILPNGSLHTSYVKQLDVLAKYLASLKVDSVFVPIIFRPFHEHNGDWFWWGKGSCTEQEYIQLWRFTVDYLRKTKNLHHILYAFSPDRSRIDMENADASYLYGYPGDNFVDILGLDDYMDVGISWNRKPLNAQRTDFVNILRTVSGIALNKNKLAAVTETGLQGITNLMWFTKVILEPLKLNPDIKIAYLVLWRNADAKHYFAPYPGHLSASDFKKFYSDPFTMFESDLDNIYKYDSKESY